LSLYVINYALRPKDVWGSGCIDLCILGLGTSWRQVVSFTPRPFYFQDSPPPPPLLTGSEAGWAPEPVSTTYRRENLSLAGILTLTLLRCSLLSVALPTALAQLRVSPHASCIVSFSTYVTGQGMLWTITGLRLWLPCRGVSQSVN
jgi:hypothetical protein